MFFGHLLGWMVVGLVVGVVARLTVPGTQNVSIIMIVVLGVGGATVGGFIGSMLFGPDVARDPMALYAVETAWPGWIMAALSGILVLGVYLAANGHRSTTDNSSSPESE